MQHPFDVKAKPNLRLSARVRSFGIWGMVLSAGTMGGPRVPAAQTVIGLQAPAPAPVTEWQLEQPDEMNVFQPAGPPPEELVPEIFQYGPVQFRPHLDYSIMDGTGIQDAPGSQQDTVIQSLAAGILADLGAHWAFDYTPTFEFYSSDKFSDVVNQSVSLTGNLPYESWNLGFSHNSTFTTTPLVATGSATEQTTHNTGITASHPLSSTMSADFSVSQGINLVSGLQDSYTWSTLEFLNYQFWPRLTAGIGIGGGYTLVDDNSQTRASTDLDQSFESINARLNWRATDKISFQLSGGLQEMQFMTPGASDSTSPIFSAAIQYAPFKVTQISLSASRSVSASDYYLAAQESTATTVGLTADQRLLKKFHLALGVSYTETDYGVSDGTAAGSAVNRTDNTISFTARLSHAFFKRGQWSVFYQYSDNDSSVPGYGFASNQTGFEVSYSY